MGNLPKNLFTNFIFKIPFFRFSYNLNLNNTFKLKNRCSTKSAELRLTFKQFLKIKFNTFFLQISKLYFFINFNFILFQEISSFTLNFIKKLEYLQNLLKTFFFFKWLKYFKLSLIGIASDLK